QLANVEHQLAVAGVGVEVPDEPVVSAGDEPAIEVTEGARVGREAGAVPCARPAMARAEQAGVHPGGEVPAAVQRPELGEEPPGDAVVVREAGEVPGPGNASTRARSRSGSSSTSSSSK